MNTKTTYHRDGTVTLWDVFSQCWRRLRATRVPAELLASLSTEESARIERHGYHVELRFNGYDKHRILTNGDILVYGTVPGSLTRRWYLFGRLGDADTAARLGM